MQNVIIDVNRVLVIFNEWILTSLLISREDCIKIIDKIKSIRSIIPFFCSVKCVYSRNTCSSKNSK